MGNLSKDSGKFADSKLLDVIDKLFSCNIGEYVALPQVSYYREFEARFSC